MSVSKAELIIQIANSSGLKGEELEKFKKQLQAKSLEDLSAMISNLKPQNVGFKNFVEMPAPTQTAVKNIWGSDITPHEESNFGFGLNEFYTTGQKTKNTPKFTPSEETAMTFLSGLTNTADNNIKTQEKSEGAVDWVVNAYKEALDKETALSNVKKDIKSTQRDIVLLNQAAAGELKRTSFISNETETISFAETYKKQRGVEFNEANIQDCEQKSNTFAQVKAATTMIKEVKSNLNSLGIGTVDSQFATKEKSEAVFNALKLCGIDKRAQMDEVLTNIEEKYKNTELFQKYGGEWQFAKIRENGVSKYKNPPEIVRMTSSGKIAQITNEQYRAITQELNLRLNKAYAATINCDIPEDASSKEIEALTQKQFDFYQKEYENSFSAAYGKKDLKALSEAYIQSQQKGVAGIQMAIDMTSMATMFVGGGAVLSGAKAVTKGYRVANAAVKGKNIYDAANAASNLTKLANVTDKVAKSKYLMKLSMGLAVANPTQVINKMTSEDGMSQEDWKSYGEEVLTKAGFMSLGMGAAKVGEFAGSMVKTKGLTKILQESGRSMDEIVDIVTKNPVKFPADIVKSLTKVREFSAATRFSTEMTMDLMTTAAMQPDGAQKSDYIMSFIGALSGGQAQKVLAPMKSDSKIKHIQTAFGELDIKLSDAEAGRVLKALDDKANGVKSGQSADAPKISSPKAIDVNKKPIEIKIAPDALKTPEFKTKLKNISHLNGKNFTEAAYDLLVKEFGIEGIAPKLVVKPMDMDFCGAFDKRTGIITINSGFDKASQIGTLAHELKHFEQYSLILNYRLGQNKNTSRSFEYTVGQMLDEVGRVDASKFNADFYRKVADKTQPLDETSPRYKEAQKLTANTIPMMSGFEKTFESPAYKVGETIEKLYYTEIEGNNSFKWAVRLTGFSSAILKNPPEFKTDLLDKAFFEKETGLIWANSLASKAESKPVQNEVGKCLAYMSEDIPDTKKPVDINKLVFQQEKWYKLPSGLSVSVRSSGDCAPVLDAGGWPTGNATSKGKRLILQVIDKEGKTHLLPATSKENVAQALKIVEYMTKTEEISYKDAINPQGMDSKDIPMLNPSDVAAQKLQEKVGLRVDEQRLGAVVPKAPLAYKAPDKDLINTIKHLNPEVMAKRYDAMEKVIDECIKNNKDKINEVVKNHPNDTKKQAEVIVGILGDAFDVKELEPEIVIKKIPNSAEFNTDNGQIAIDPSVHGVSDITGILSHEFVHFLQMKEIVANSGEKGLRDLMKDTPLNEQDKIINTPFIQKLLKYSKENPQNPNSINSYMARIYKDEYIDYKMPDASDNNQGYHSQLIEKEGYFLGNNAAKDAAQKHLNATDFDNLRVIEKGDGYEVLEDGTIRRTAINSPAGLLDKGKNWFNAKKMFAQIYNDKASRTPILYSAAECVKLNKALEVVCDIRPDLLTDKTLTEKLKAAIVTCATKSSGGKDIDLFKKMISKDVDAQALECFGAFSVFYAKPANMLYDAGLSNKQVNALLLENNGRFYDSKIPNQKIEDIFTLMLAQNAKSLKELPPDVLDQIYELAHVQSELDILKTYDIGVKKVLKETIDKIPENIQKDLSENGIDVIVIKNKLDLGLDRETNSIQTPAKKEMFNFVANNKKSNDDLLINIDFDKYGKTGIPLKYSRSSFTTDIKALLATLPAEKQKEVANHFNLKLTNDGFEGFPQVKSNDGLKLSEAEQKTAAQINQNIERFTLKNETALTNPAEKALFDQLIKGSPEFTSTISKLQHGEHAYSIDIHTMKVLQSAMKNPLYAKLSDKDKTVLKLAVLTHDMGKPAGQVDDLHPQLSADYASAILDKYNLSQDVKERVTNLVRHSHFFQTFNTGKADYRFEQLFRNPADRRIAKIFAQSDLESVSLGFADRILGGESFDEAFSSIGPMRFGLGTKKKTGNAHALRNFPKESFVINGKTQEVEILDLRKISPDEDLTKYGLEPGTKKQDLRLVVHMVKDFSDIKNIHELSKQPNYDMTLSSTYTDINVPDNYGTIGVSLSVNPYNMGSFTNGTTGSKWGKGFDEFWDPKSNPSFANVDIEKLATSKDANEGLALNPKIGQIIINSKNLTTDKIDPNIIRFANENNYRIIILGN